MPLFHEARSPSIDELQSLLNRIIQRVLKRVLKLLTRTGYQLAERIRAQAALKDVVLVALTGYGHESAKHNALAAGFTHHITKPADFQELKQILDIIS